MQMNAHEAMHTFEMFVMHTLMNCTLERCMLLKAAFYLRFSYLHAAIHTESRIGLISITMVI